MSTSEVTGSDPRVASLEERRERLAAQMTALTDKAEAEGRDFSRRETAQFRHLEREAEAVADAIRWATSPREPLKCSQASGSESRGGETSGGSQERTGGWLYESRALAEGSGTGGYLVPEQYLPRVWDRLTAESVGLRSGFTVVNTDRDTLHIPRLVSDAAVNWTAEAATISPTDPVFAEIVATPRKLAGLTTFSNELRDDSNPSVIDVLERNLMRAIALKLDLGFYEGSGTPPEIRGLKNVSGITEISAGTNGAAATLDIFADAIGQLAVANAKATAIVMAPRTWAGMVKLKTGISGDNSPLWGDRGSVGVNSLESRLFGIPVLLTSQLSITETQGSATNASSAYVYQASEVIAVRRQEMRLELDPYRLFNSDQSELRAISRWDLAVPNPAAVVRIKGLIP